MHQIASASSQLKLSKAPIRLSQLPRSPIQISRLAGGATGPLLLRPPLPGMSLSDINSKLPKQPVPRAQIGNASPSSKASQSPIKVVAIASPQNRQGYNQLTIYKLAPNLSCCSLLSKNLFLNWTFVERAIAILIPE
jgi:hypothetical protein